MLRAELAISQIGARLQAVAEQSLTASAGLWLAATLLFYFIALQLFRRCGGHPLLHPLSLTVCAVAAVMWITGTSAAQYRHDAALLQWLLGPATVALAVPMFNQWQKIKSLGAPLLLSVAVGGIVAPMLAWGVIYLTHAPLAIQMTMLVKSITSPLAMETGAAIGGVPALAAVFVIVTGIVGAVAAPVTFKTLTVKLPEAQGVALGAVCHAVGTAKALQTGPVQGALATVGLCINGIFTALVLPLLF
ncbi:LrgB family protein [Alteromonas gilva]|uniref:LrgB family protein n=1 Tax=Alteromonas gilva TaxID=2987522 RepID=A0ABT5KZF8_9ALTE|nr:LrgB family protein [Alteromonas gilva]MDC8830163.1 LrgB family protein [Alteromonas gilva]